MGNLLQVATVSGITTADFAAYSATTRAIDAGTTNLSVWSRTVNIGNHSANLKAATFRYIGSASTDAVANLSLYVDSVKVAGPVTVNAANDNKITFDLASTPYVLLTGNHTVELRGDVVKGSSRSITYAVENAGDLMIEDAQLVGVNITPKVAGAGFSRLTYDTFNVNSGSVTVNTDPAFVTNNVTGGASNMTIGQYTFKAYGEDVKVSSLNVLPVISFSGVASTTATLSNVTLYVNGGQIGTAQNFDAATLVAKQYSLGSSLIVPAGTSVTVTVKADLRNAYSVNYTTGTIAAQLSVGASNGQGQSSYTIANVPQASILGTSLTVSSGAGTFSRTAGFTNQTVNPNSTTPVKVGSFTIQASSAEGLVVTGATLNVSTTGSFQNISNLTVKNGSTLLSTPIGQVNSTNSVNFNSLEVATNGVSTFDVYADLGNATSSSSYTVGMTINYRGKISNTVGSATNAGAVSTVNVANLASSTLVSSSPSAQFVVGGSTYNVATFKLSTLTSGTTANVRQINFATLGADAIESITIAGGTPTPVVDGVAIVTGLNLSVSSTGTDVPVTVKFAGFRDSTTGGNLSTSVSSVQVGIQYVEATSGSGSVITNSFQASSSVMKLVASKPTVSVSAGNTDTLTLGSENKIGEFTVTADANGKISVSTTSIDVSAVGITGPEFTAARIADGNTTISSATVTGSSTIVASFTPAYEISAGQSKTFSVYAVVSGTLQASITPYVTSRFTSAASFNWRDVIGGNTSQLGTSIYNFPTSSFSTKR